MRKLFALVLGLAVSQMAFSQRGWVGNQDVMTSHDINAGQEYVIAPRSIDPSLTGTITKVGFHYLTTPGHENAEFTIKIYDHVELQGNYSQMHIYDLVSSGEACYTQDVVASGNDQWLEFELDTPFAIPDHDFWVGLCPNGPSTIAAGDQANAVMEQYLYMENVAGDFYWIPTEFAYNDNFYMFSAALAVFIDEGGVNCQAPDNLQGQATEDGALIEWSFAQRDFQLDHFNVYRSATNSDYELVAEVTGNGPDYSYLDPVTEGAWYYRVTAVHADGTEICESEPAATPDGKVYVAIDMTFDLGDWLYYDNGYCATAVGRGDEMYWGVKFPKEMLADMQGKSLSRVAIYEGESCSGSYEMSFYLGGDNAPETIADVQSFELFGTDQWHFEDLPSPLPVSDDMNLWIVFHTTDVAYPAAVSPDDFDNPNGRWISENGVNWADMAEVVTPGYTFMIRAFFSTYDGVEQSFGSFAEVYPNPVCGTLHVVAEGLQKVDVFDLCGRLVLQSNESEIDMSSFLSGLYLVRVTTETGVISQRVEVK